MTLPLLSILLLLILHTHQDTTKYILSNQGLGCLPWRIHETVISLSWKNILRSTQKRNAIPNTYLRSIWFGIMRSHRSPLPFWRGNSIGKYLYTFTELLSIPWIIAIDCPNSPLHSCCTPSMMTLLWIARPSSLRFRSITESETVDSAE